MRKRNSAVTLLFSEKVPRIAGLFWARFSHREVEDFWAYVSAVFFITFSVFTAGLHDENKHKVYMKLAAPAGKKVLGIRENT